MTDSDIYKKLVEMETLADSRLKSITLLETQKFELVQGKIAVMNLSHVSYNVFVKIINFLTLYDDFQNYMYCNKRTMKWKIN